MRISFANSWKFLNEELQHVEPVFVQSLYDDSLFNGAKDAYGLDVDRHHNV